jgi:hypothetical protein
MFRVYATRPPHLTGSPGKTKYTFWLWMLLEFYCTGGHSENDRYEFSVTRSSEKVSCKSVMLHNQLPFFPSPLTTLYVAGPVIRKETAIKRSLLYTASLSREMLLHV